MALCLACLLCAWSGRVAPLQAQSEESAASTAPQAGAALQAKELFDQGVIALAAQRWDDAEALFRRSAQLVYRSSSLYNRALALFELQRFRECIEACEGVLAGADERDLARYRAATQQLRNRALAAVGSLLLSVEPAAATVLVSGEPTPAGTTRRLALDPGLHNVAASAAGYLPRELVIEVKRGEQTAVTLALLPAVPAAPEARAEAPRSAPPREPPALAPTGAAAARTSSTLPALLMLGAGSALLIGGLVTGLLANANDREFTRRCGGTTNCDLSLRPLQRETEALALATDILLGTGALVAGTGVVLFWIDDAAAEPSAERAALLPRGIGVQARGVW